MAHRDLKVIPATDNQRELAQLYVKQSREYRAAVDPIRTRLGLKPWEGLPAEERTEEIERLAWRLQLTHHDLCRDCSESPVAGSKRAEHLIDLARQGRL